MRTSVIFEMACSALIYEDPQARGVVAVCLRYYRNTGDKAMVQHCMKHFSFIGWPAKSIPHQKSLRQAA